MPGTCFRTPSLCTALHSIKWRASNQNFEGINSFPIHSTCPTGRAFLGFIFVVCFMARYCHILVSIVRIINCKRLWRKLSCLLEMLIQHFPGYKKKRRTTVGMDGKPTKIRNQNLPHTCLQCFPCSIHAFLVAQQYHELLVKCILHFPFRIPRSKFPFRQFQTPSKSVLPAKYARLTSHPHETYHYF